MLGVHSALAELDELFDLVCKAVESSSSSVVCGEFQVDATFRLTVVYLLQRKGLLPAGFEQHLVNAVSSVTELPPKLDQAQALSRLVVEGPSYKSGRSHTQTIQPSPRIHIRDQAYTPDSPHSSDRAVFNQGRLARMVCII